MTNLSEVVCYVTFGGPPNDGCETFEGRLVFIETKTSDPFTQGEVDFLNSFKSIGVRVPKQGE
jgi:hypothetical protein